MMIQLEKVRRPPTSFSSFRRRPAMPIGAAGIIDGREIRFAGVDIAYGQKSMKKAMMPCLSLLEHRHRRRDGIYFTVMLYYIS